MKSTINKPWGSYTIIENGKDYVVKKLVIKTNEKTSLQSHDFRSEHWIVVQGIAEVTINKETKTIREEGGVIDFTGDFMKTSELESTFDEEADAYHMSELMDDDDGEDGDYMVSPIDNE